MTSSPCSRPSTPPIDAASAPSDKSSAQAAAASASPESSTSPEPQATAGPSTSTAAPGVPTASAGDWQAIWSPQHNAYYFYNAATQETTWTNPLEAGTPSSASASAPDASGSQPSPAVSSLYAMQAAAAAQGIDPSLAYLDPSLAAGTSSSPAAFTYTAKFNARTGQFARPDARDPTHLSEYERAKRMSEAYFDVNEWEQEVAQRKEQEEAEGKKRKRPTKKDLERFKEQKRLKKIAKTAWLRT